MRIVVLGATGFVGRARPVHAALGAPAVRDLVR